MSFRLENGRYVPENGSNGGPPSASQESQPDRNAQAEAAAEVPPTGTPPGIRHPPPNVLADIMEEYQRTNARLMVHQNTLLPILRGDEAMPDEATTVANQTLFNNISQISHHLSHAQHAMSDIMINFARPPPRQLRARPFVIQSLVQSAVVQAGPISFNLGEALMGRPASVAASTTTTSSSSQSARPSASAAPATAESGRNTSPSSAFHNAIHEAVHGQAVAAAAANTEFSLGGRFGNARVSVRSDNGSVVDNEAARTPGEAASTRAAAAAAGAGGATTTRTRHIRTASDDIQALVNSALHEALRSIPGMSAAAPPTRGAAAAQGQQPPAGQSGRAGQPNGPVRQIPISVPLGGPQMAMSAPGVGNFNSFDPFLQCSSHHIASSRSSPQGGSRGRPVRSTPSSAPTSRTASLDRRSTVNRPRAAPATLGSTWMSPPPFRPGTAGFVFGVAPGGITVSHHPGPHIHHHHHPGPAAAAAAAGGHGNGAEPLMAGVSNLLGMMLSGAGSAAAPGPEDAGVINMIQGVMGHVMSAMGGGSSGLTVAEFLNSLPDYNYSPGESIVTDLLMILAQNLTFQVKIGRLVLCWRSGMTYSGSGFHIQNYSGPGSRYGFNQ